MTRPEASDADARDLARASADASATDGFALPGAPDAFERFWNAHRMAYVTQGSDQVKDEHTCPFCAAPQRSDEESLIVHRGRTAATFAPSATCRATSPALSSVARSTCAVARGRSSSVR